MYILILMKYKYCNGIAYQYATNDKTVQQIYTIYLYTQIFGKYTNHGNLSLYIQIE
jgi:hypothetical protein